MPDRSDGCSPHLQLSRVMEKVTGGPRLLGVEIELSGLELGQMARCIVDCLGGVVEEVSAYEQKVVDTELGDFQLELDFSYLKRWGRERRQLPPDSIDLEQLAEEALAAMARNIVPYELVSPPMPFCDLHRLDRVVAALRKAGAKGTRHAPHYAFGVHFNPELPALNSHTLLRYFKAYLCLHDWLDERQSTSLARKLTPFIKPFSTDYCRQVLEEDYWPGFARFTDDYLQDNASRNRSLDLLPILAYVDELRVREQVGDAKVNPRPTLHYRLPNSDIDNPSWRLENPWRDWLQVEALANDEARLEKVCNLYLAHLESLSPDWLDPWKDRVKRWLVDL